MMLPKVSIIVCTCNRVDSLRETIGSVGHCRNAEDFPSELIIVDNGPSDATRGAVVSSYLENGIPVRYIEESRLGKGFAYNTGMAEARGGVFLFTDDDVRVPTDWIERMCRPILSGVCDAVIGGIRLAEHLRRDWMTPRHRVLLAENIDDVDGTFLTGANMAFSASVLERVPGFDPELGPGALGFGDDTLFSTQIREAGYRIMPLRDCVVEHHFDSSRLSRKAFKERAYKEGRSIAFGRYHHGHETVPAPLLYSMKRRLRLAYERTRHWQDSRAREGIPLWELDIITSIGFFDEMHRLRGQARKFPKATEAAPVLAGAPREVEGSSAA